MNISFEEAVQAISRKERLQATVYAMGSLLIHKGIYTREEFQALFVEWTRKELRKKSRARLNGREASSRNGRASVRA